MLWCCHTFLRLKFVLDSIYTSIFARVKSSAEENKKIRSVVGEIDGCTLIRQSAYLVTTRTSYRTSYYSE